MYYLIRGASQVYIANAYNYLLRYLLRTNVDGHINDIKNLFAIPTALIHSSSDLVLHTAYTTEQDNDHKIEFYTLKHISLL